MSELVSGQRFGTPIITPCIRVVVHGRHIVLLGELAPTNVFGPESPNRIVQVCGHKLHVCPPQGCKSGLNRLRPCEGNNFFLAEGENEEQPKGEKCKSRGKFDNDMDLNLNWAYDQGWALQSASS